MSRVVALFCFVVLGVASGRGEGMAAAPLETCPDTPNCVSSVSGEDARHRVEPFRYEGRMETARKALLEALAEIPRAVVARDDGDYLRVECSSRVLRLVDDLELHFSEPGVIQVRSASRVGGWDFGVNRRRVESLRSDFMRNMSNEILITGKNKGKGDRDMTSRGDAPRPGTVIKSDTEWRRELTPEQYRIMREKGTERAFTGAYWDEKGRGVYRCVACGNELFGSGEKFDSGTGWPSFTAPVAGDSVGEVADESHGMQRTEVVCSRCGAHLGHVFDDGPGPTGLRYCINSVALDFVEDPGP